MGPSLLARETPQPLGLCHVSRSGAIKRRRGRKGRRRRCVLMAAARARCRVAGGREAGGHTSKTGGRTWRWRALAILPTGDDWMPREIQNRSAYEVCCIGDFIFFPYFTEFNFLYSLFEMLSAVLPPHINRGRGAALLRHDITFSLPSSNKIATTYSRSLALGPLPSPLCSPHAAGTRFPTFLPQFPASRGKIVSTGAEAMRSAVARLIRSTFASVSTSRLR